MNLSDRLNKQGGLNISHSNGETPCFGKIWFVDGTNGSATGDGDNPSEALSTVALALTAWAAGTSSLGDIIYVLPGNYAEATTGTLLRVQLIGATCGGTPEVVSLRPTTGSGFAGSMENSAIRNLDIRNSSSTAPTAGAVVLTDMLSSIIDNCAFSGANTNAASTGFVLGAAGASEFMLYSRLTNCTFGTWAARTNEFKQGIMIGTSTTNAGTRKIAGSVIADNIIMAKDFGIHLYTASDTGMGAVIARNVIGSCQSELGANEGLYKSGDKDLLIKVIDNRISAVNNGIYNFADANTLWNCVSINGTPIMDLPDTD